jgi:hypothetical protein
VKRRPSHGFNPIGGREQLLQSIRILRVLAKEALTIHQFTAIMPFQEIQQNLIQFQVTLVFVIFTHTRESLNCLVPTPQVLQAS